MSILTARELEFLASLPTNWRRLYWNELAHLLKQDDNPCDARHETQSIAPRSASEKYQPRLVYSSDETVESTIEGLARRANQ